MRKIGSKKRFALVASTVAAVLIGSGVAVAFWTTTGTGSGQADTGDTTTLAVTQTNTIVDLYPGGPAQDIDLDIANGGTIPQTISNVAITISSITPAGCTAGNFTVTNAAIAGGNNNIAVGANPFSGAATGASISLDESGSNQNICKNATVNLAFSAS